MGYSISVVTPPASEPVTLDEFKAQLKRADTAEDALLTRCLVAARQQFEESSDGCILMPTTFRQTGHSWCDVMRLQVGNVTAVSNVKYFPPDDDEATMDTDDYDYDLGTVATIRPHYFPALSTLKIKPVSVTFVAGYANAAAVPAAIKVAILELAAVMNRYRTAYDPEVLNPVQSSFDRVCRLYKTGLGGF